MSETQNNEGCNRALEGMLREYLRAGTGDDDQLVIRIMDSLDDVVLPTRRSLILRLWPAWAAMLVITCGGLFSLLRNQPQPALPLAFVRSGAMEIRRDHKQITAASGTPVLAGDRATVRQTATIDTPCGSRVKLANGSDVEFPRLKPAERMNVKLHAGRAFFRVSKSPKQFTVQGSARIEVKGTTFGISESASQTVVSVYEGHVRLRSVGATIELSRGQSGKATGSTAPEPVSVDPNVALKWAREQTRFESAPIGEILRWITQNSSYRIKTTAAIRQDMRISFEADDEDPAEILDVIATCCGLRWEEEGNWLVLTK